jgi:hypothetical protein
MSDDWMRDDCFAGTPRYQCGGAGEGRYSLINSIHSLTVFTHYQQPAAQLRAFDKGLVGS